MKSRNARNAVALYTIAIEEFGKLLLLKEASEINTDKSEIEVDKAIFGFGKDGHNKKFVTALEQLPEECRVFLAIDINLQMINQRKKLPSEFERLVNVGRSIRDELEKNHGKALEFIIAQGYDFEVRKNLFYVNWNKKNNRWEEEFNTDSQTLMAWIEKLRDILSETW